MSKVEILRTLVNQRLTAAAEEIFGLLEKTMVEYEEELSRSQQNIVRLSELLYTTFNPEVRLHRADILQQELSPSLDQEEPEPSHIKDEQEEPWICQEGEQHRGEGEAGVTKFPFIGDLVKIETDEAKVQPSQLHQIQTENTELAPSSSCSTEQDNSEAGGEDCGEPEPARTLDPGSLLQLACDDKASDSSQHETGHTEVTCKETRDPQLGLNTPNYNELPLNNMQRKRCGATFKYDKSLQRRMGNHKRQKKACCLVCGKYFSRNVQLNMHMRIHTGEKPFKCSFCGNEFNQRGNLKRHIRIHTGERPFSCSICSKKFTVSSYLKIHMRVHTGEKPFSCKVCGKRFIASGAVKSHMRIHTR